MSTNLRSLDNNEDLELLAQEYPDYPDIAQLIQLYPEELAAKIVNNKHKLEKLKKTLGGGNLAFTANALALMMVCSKNCPHHSCCPLAKADLAPYGHPCPLEKKIISELECDLVETLEVDRNNPIEMGMLWDLIEFHLYDMRASSKLNNGLLVQTVETTIGNNKSSRDEIAPELTAKIEIKKLKQSIRDEFVASRRAKLKYGINTKNTTLEDMILNAAKNIDGNSED